MLLDSRFRGNDELFSFQPAVDAARRLAHASFRTGVTEADVAPAAIGIKIDARCDGDANVLEHGLGESFAVGAESADIGIEVEAPSAGRMDDSPARGSSSSSMARFLA